MIKTRAVSLAFLALFVLSVHADRQADQLYEEAIRLHGSAKLEEVFSLYTRAAELGNAAAQYNIAMMYANGEAVNVDYQQAVYWFRKSASQQFAPAQYRLGELYFFGMGGLPEDTKTAGRLFKAAAEQGDPDAQVNLALLLGTDRYFPWIQRKPFATWCWPNRVATNRRGTTLNSCGPLRMAGSAPRNGRRTGNSRKTTGWKWRLSSVCVKPGRPSKDLPGTGAEGPSPFGQHISVVETLFQAVAEVTGHDIALLHRRPDLALGVS